MTVTVYGIKSCNSIKKALIMLDTLGVRYQFHDYKKQGVDRQSVQRWVKALGLNNVLNKRGTTWRGLTDEQKASADAETSAAIELLLSNTSMIKRPIIEGEYQGSSILLCGLDDLAKLG